MSQNKNMELEIMLVLINGESHLREIARTLNESPSTTLRKINELAKENILNYTKKGKNKVFFIKNNLKAKNYVYSAEIYKLSKLLKKHPELSIIFEDVKKNVLKGMIVLFGSYAKGNAKQGSDIDIYVETTDVKVKNKLQELNSKISVKIGKFNKDSLLVKEIIKNHVVIRGVEEFYEKSEFFENA